MSKTLLAVDDSATMRKVFEITFGGEDFNVLTADNREAALAKLKEDPRVVMIDAALGDDDGYALAREVRAKSQNAIVILLASKQNPYDAAKGKDAGVDDYMDKPFDTQAAIDKVRKVILARESGGAAVSAPPAAAAAPPPPAAQLSQTAPSLRIPSAEKPEPSAPRAAEAAKAAPAPARAAAPASSAASAAVNGAMAGKLTDLGLTAQQAEAVIALTRDVVEKAVWEVVPQLAEALIKEEIARLMK